MYLIFIFHCCFNRTNIYRINWTEPWVPSNNYSISKAAATSSGNTEGDLTTTAMALPPGVTAEAAMENARFYEGGEEGVEGEGDEDDDGDDDSDAEGETGGTSATTAGATDHHLQQHDQQEQGQATDNSNNRCDMLWQGQLPKRCFPGGFKFQESATPAAARKMMKGKGVGHYWDMLEGADSLIASAEAPALF